jgi:hypothetical protein
MAGWQHGSAADLIRALRPGGGVLGHSPSLTSYITLHKTDLIADLRREEEGKRFSYYVRGNPDQHGRYAPDRRTVIVWLGAPVHKSDV